MNSHKWKLMIIVCCVFCNAGALAQAAFTYAESMDVIANPERGLYLYGGDEIDHSNGCWWGSDEKFGSYKSSLDDAKAQGITLVYMQYDLGAYRLAPTVIPAAYFACVDRDFQEAKNRGFKVILRFSYNYRHRADGGHYDDYREDKPKGDCREQGTESNTCEPKIAQVLNNLKQKEFSDFITRNARLISVWQAGFLGKYGEWYYTSTEAGIKSDSKMPVRAPILKQMLEMLPAPGVIQVRTPFYKEYAIRSLPDSSPAEKKVIADFRNRIGLFDDSFFDNDEYNTYGNFKMGVPETRDFWKHYVSIVDTHVPTGGETSTHVVIYTPKEDAQIDQVMAEFTKYHWSFFSYSKVKAPDGQTNWTYLISDKKKRLQKFLGYRLYLSSATFATSVKPGDKLPVTLDLANSGTAPPFKTQKVRFILCRAGAPCPNGGKGIASPDQIVDMRTWLPGTAIKVSGTVPTDGLEPGEYELFLQLADRDLALPTDPGYAIHLANIADAKDKSGKKVTGLFGWNEATELNRFGKITIK